MGNLERTCLRCEEKKILNIGNFKRREAYLDFKPSYDSICRYCRDKAINNNKRYVKKKKLKRACALIGCINTFETSVGTKKFCSKKCYKKAYDARLKGERIERDQAKEIGGQIPEKFLVRGKIYGVDYR